MHGLLLGCMVEVQQNPQYTSACWTLHPHDSAVSSQLLAVHSTGCYAALEGGHVDGVVPGEDQTKQHTRGNCRGVLSEWQVLQRQSC